MLLISGGGVPVVHPEFGVACRAERRDFYPGG